MAGLPSNIANRVQYLNPETLHCNPAFTQAVAVSGAVKTVYVGGQNAVDASAALGYLG